MKISDIATQYKVDRNELEHFLRFNSNITVHESFRGISIDDSCDIPVIIDDFKFYQNKQAILRAMEASYPISSSTFDDFLSNRFNFIPSTSKTLDDIVISDTNCLDSLYQQFLSYQQGIPLKISDIQKYKVEADLTKQEAMAKMLISSGFTFEGYRIVKYSGYISGDDAIQVARGTHGLFSSATNVGESLMASLKEMRRQALKELKEAAYDLGCNAVIGVDFDYITLEPETANTSGGTTYLPYVFGVTANGNAVIIEKIETNIETN